jgi:ATP-dependent Lon protease
MTDTPVTPPPPPESLPEILPILPLFDAVLFPKMVLPLVVMKGESVKLVDEAMARDRIIGLVVSKHRDPPEEGVKGELCRIGCAALILKMAKTHDERTQLLVQGLGRFRVLAFRDGKSYIEARVAAMADRGGKDDETEALINGVVAQFARIVELSPGLPGEIVQMARSIQAPGTLADMICSTISAGVDEKQGILELADAKERLKAVMRLCQHQLDILELGNKIQTQVRGDMEKSQREYFLRQQLKIIREELGEKDDGSVEIEELRGRIGAKNLPEEARREAERELDRLARMHPSSAEYTVASTYLDWITALPWHEQTKDALDIQKARKVLDEDHFGLEKPKRRIIEYLAVRKLKPGSKGPILCFAGPPGTGKTSLGQSIARALGRKFVRISLGGVRDEAEIRGHRRTYVGALPGRIIQGLRRAGVSNPVFMLDEIDKVGGDFRGDPAAALLEVLDPEQNHAFVDHYLDVPFDLTRVMFITTANILDTIPPALRDRMEVLSLVGYTLEEKLKIAHRHLIPRQREEHGLAARQIRITASAVKQIVAGYTREAGLRNLEREIAAICRGAASKIAQGRAKSVRVGVESLPRYLGPQRFAEEGRLRTATPGVATGLAWTPVGGELLTIEASAMRGQKGLTLTGQLGDVMKESAAAALSYVRAHAAELGIAEDFFNTLDIHIHIPAGAIPKDGPSAGVTLLAALVSRLTGRPVRPGLAMTGEITLRGQVLPVGGIKEKVLAAHRLGVKAVVLPSGNRKDLEEVPRNVREAIRFHFVETMAAALELALPGREAPRPPRARRQTAARPRAKGRRA